MVDRPVVPDVKIRSTQHSETATESRGATAVSEATPQTFVMHGLVETEMREIFLEIRELDDQSRVVTCIEVLSPSNKRLGSAGWYLYQRKRQAFLQGHAHLVEIDLLRGGQRMPMVGTWSASPYHIAVMHKESAPKFEVTPAHFKVPLPSIQIPLRRPDPDIALPLQPLVDAIYTRSKYHLSFNYRRPIFPPLNSVETGWLEQQLAAR